MSRYRLVKNRLTVQVQSNLKIQLKMSLFNTLLLVTTVIFCYFQNIETSVNPLFIKKFTTLNRNNQQQSFHDLKCLACLLIKMDNIYREMEDPFSEAQNWTKHEEYYKFLPKSPQNKTSQDVYNDLSFYYRSFKFLYHRQRTEDKSDTKKLKDFKDKAKAALYSIENLLENVQKLDTTKSVAGHYTLEHQKGTKFLNQKYTMLYFWRYLKDIRCIVADELEKNSYLIINGLLECMISKK